MTTQDMERVKRTVIRRYPIFASIALFNVPITEDKSVNTAAVVGEKNEKGEIDLKGIIYNPDFFDSLTFEQQVFVLAHETCHIAFKHFARSLDKPEKDIQRKYEEYCINVQDENLRKIEKIRLTKKYNTFWNIATDACINAFLKKDGLEMPENVIDKRTGEPMNFVNIADGLYRRAELIYDSLVKKDEEKQKKEDNSNKNMDKDSNGNDSLNDINENSKENNSGDKQDKNESSSNDIGGDLDNIDIDNYQGIDSHESWANEPKQKEEKKDAEQKESKSLSERIKGFFERKKQKNQSKQEEKDNNLSEISTDEASVFEENERKLKEEQQNAINNAFNNLTKEVGCSEVKLVKPVLSWKHLLIRSVEEETEKWGYRRANRYMPNARIQDISQEDKATTEIILDTSGSVSDKLLKAFLRQLVPLFKETEIKVGCFAGEFYGFKELKSIKQIEEFKAIRDTNGTNYEAAATAFTKENGVKRINKIVFTDGELDDVSYHVQKTRVDDIIWIVFGDKMNFKPVGGKIIRVSQKDLSQMLSMTNLSENKIRFTDDSNEMTKKRR